MLPTRLELKNFLAYQNPDPIYFEGIHLACLSGPNGAGKSSLLDAITWAIWGKARARSDDDLIHLGCDEMSVTLEFLQGDARYRILRQRRLGNKRKSGGRAAGTTTLDLVGWVPEENTFRVISEPSVRQTQARIEDLVGVDYETFVNSAYLQQGHADAFTVQTPAHRKKILSEILNLDVWQDYEELAKLRLREINSELQAIGTNLREIEKEIAEEPAIQREYALAQEQHDTAREQMLHAETRYRELAGADHELNAAQNELNQVRFQIGERERDIASTEAQITHYHQRLEDYQAMVLERESIEAGYARLQEAREADQALGDALRQLHQIDQWISSLREQIATARQGIEQDITSSETLISEGQSQTETIDDLSSDLNDVRSELALLEQDEARREILRQEISELREDEARRLTENDTLRREMEDIKQRLELIEQTTAPTCPLCGQSLPEAHREELVIQFTAEGKSRGDRWRENRDRLSAIQDEIKEREQSIAILEKTLPKLGTLRSHLGSLEQQLMNAQNAQRRVAELEKQVAHLKSRLEERDYARDLHAQLAEAEAQRAQLAYDPDAHSAIRETLETYQTYQEKSTALEVALQQIPDVQHSLEEAEARADRWRKSLADLEAQATQIQAQIEHLQAQVAEMQRRENEWQLQRTTERQMHEKVISLRQRLASIESMRQRHSQLEARSQSLQEERGIYEQLRNAFSRNGIPAMVIEAAIPELEDATNRLLSRMTSGRLAVRFDTQREKKTGGVAETFDIWISDELGTRDYSLYSGGEAFRVNFAIRVAISQLLARRAGAQLRTLFIDEGFGTQDESGRERLVEAINAIQEDFDLILVITHIDELRDAFPVRIEVEKLAGGSRIRVI